MKKLILLLLIVLLVPALALAGTFQLEPDLKIVLSELSDPWAASTEPNPELIDHLAEHVIEEAAEKGHQLSMAQARELAMKRAGNNQLFVSNRQSGAHLLISFSRLDQGETAPSAETVAKSAEYAADGVADEGWAVISRGQARTAVKGAQQAEWFSIEYTHEGETSRFMGIVGFADPYWFWFYGNDHLKDPADAKTLEKLMLGIEIQAGSR